MNGVIVIDKPAGWTSHDVVGKLRGLLHEKRIGHGGTLDPMATGVLPVFVGRATRAVQFCESAHKEYLAGMRVGLTTDTQDITGKTLSQSGKTVTGEELSLVLPEFTGDITQIPPMYSAVKIGGEKLYKLARRGVEVERQPRPVTISLLELTGRDGDDFLLRIVCSKGTYVRTLCHDIGGRLGCGAVMSSLRRTRAGGFTLSDSVTLDEVAAAAAKGLAEGILRPTDFLFRDYPEARADGDAEARIRNGADYAAPLPDGRYRVYGESGEFLMLGSVSGGVMSAVKSFYEV